MLYSAKSARYADGYRLHIQFSDGKSGIVDFQKYISQGGVFLKLQALEYFKKFEINQDFGVITWGNEIDIAPETVYSDATNEPLPQWMTSPGAATKAA
ncbi:MAG: DUF2442 domain-containing protein [Candidatus Ozemobacteraceae bacterium]